MSIPCQFEFSGSHLYESVIHFVSLVFRTAPISIGHCLVRLCLDFWGRTYINQSFILSIQLSRPHLYQSVIVLSVCVWIFGATPILIDHFHVSSVFGAASTSIGHLPINLCSVRFGIVPIPIGHSSCQFSFQHRTYIDQSFILSVQFSRSHLY